MSSQYGGSHFASTHFLPNHYGRPVVPDGIHPPGLSDDPEARYRRILIEDEIILAVIMAFLDIKDR